MLRGASPVRPCALSSASAGVAAIDALATASAGVAATDALASAAQSASISLAMPSGGYTSPPPAQPPSSRSVAGLPSPASPPSSSPFQTRQASFRSSRDAAAPVWVLQHAGALPAGGGTTGGGGGSVSPGRVFGREGWSSHAAASAAAAPNDAEQLPAALPPPSHPSPPPSPPAVSGSGAAPASSPSTPPRHLLSESSLAAAAAGHRRSGGSRASSSSASSTKVPSTAKETAATGAASNSDDDDDDRDEEEEDASPPASEPEAANEADKDEEEDGEEEAALVREVLDALLLPGANTVESAGGSTSSARQGVAVSTAPSLVASSSVALAVRGVVLERLRRLSSCGVAAGSGSSYTGSCEGEEAAVAGVLDLLGERGRAVLGAALAEEAMREVESGGRCDAVAPAAARPLQGEPASGRGSRQAENEEGDKAKAGVPASAASEATAASLSETVTSAPLRVAGAAVRSPLLTALSIPPTLSSPRRPSSADADVTRPLLAPPSPPRPSPSPLAAAAAAPAAPSPLEAAAAAADMSPCVARSVAASPVSSSRAASDAAAAVAARSEGGLHQLRFLRARKAVADLERELELLREFVVSGGGGGGFGGLSVRASLPLVLRAGPQCDGRAEDPQEVPQARAAAARGGCR